MSARHLVPLAVPLACGAAAMGVLALSPVTAEATRRATVAAVGALRPAEPVQGLSLGGLSLHSADVGTDVTALARALEGREVLVTDEPSGLSRRMTLGALGVRVDADETRRRVLAVGREGSFAVRFATRLAVKNGGANVPVVVDVAPETLLALVLARKDVADTAPVSARYDFGRARATAHRDGSLLAADDAVDALRELAERLAADGPSSGEDGAELTLALPRRTVAPEVTTDMVESMDVHETLAAYETWFSTGGGEAPRAKNIGVAASRLDGLVLAPGEVVSFNDVVGPRTVERGFFRAHQIYKGEMIEGVGGGTCQVASTFHAAAFYAGMDIVERAPHSRPLGYIGLGLDATVVYPEVDLKIKNPWNFPIAVHSWVEGPKLRVEVHGARKPADVLVSTTTLDVQPFRRKVEVHPELAAGRFIRKEKGIRGYDIQVMRRTTRLGGETRVDTSRDRYPPTPELYWVAPDLNVEESLPPLPEGAVDSEAGNALPEASDSTSFNG